MQLLKIILFIFIVSGIISCRSTPISEMSQEDGIAKIKEDYNDDSWSEVISSVDEYKARYPYSKFVVEADLLQADAYYNSGKYAEAIVAYEDFTKKNPNHEKAKIAYYRIAKCYDSQAPEQVDREQSNAKKAIVKYKHYLKLFPNRDPAPEVIERVEILTRRLAEHEAFIARFYWKKDHYSASLARYTEILKNYKQYDDLRTEAIERSAECYEELANLLEDDPESDKFKQFIGAKPDDLRKKAQEYRKLL